MCPHVIAVVRSATELQELVYRARGPAPRGLPWKLEHVCELRPLGQGARPDLWEAWRALERVSDWDARTLRHVLTILRETVPSSSAGRGGPALSAGPARPSPPRATAAHPRAYRGTRQRPPRPRQPDTVDARVQLLQRRDIDQVLAAFGHRRGVDPHLQGHSGVGAAAPADAWFAIHLLPLLSGCARGEVGAFAALARSLDLRHEVALHAALVGVLLSAGDSQRALAWWSHVLAHAPAQRLQAAQLVAASDVATVMVGPDVQAEIATLEAIRRWSFFRGLARGASAEYLLSGLRLDAISGAEIAQPAPGHRDVTAMASPSACELRGRRTPRTPRSASRCVS